LAGKRAPETAFVGDTDSGDRQGAISHFPDPYHFDSEIFGAAPFAEMMGKLLQTTKNDYGVVPTRRSDLTHFQPIYIRKTFSLNSLYTRAQWQAMFQNRSAVFQILAEDGTQTLRE
jgi:hypothetical protein